jgi:hypothetical protein
MNSHFLENMGCGNFSLLEAVGPRVIHDFLGGLDRFAAPLDRVRGRLDGTDRVVEVVERRLVRRVSDAA